MFSLFKNNPFQESPLRRSLREFTASVEDARRMESEGTAPPWPTHLAEGMYKGVAIADVPTWSLESLTQRGPLEYALGEAVGHELLRREMGVESASLEDALTWSLQKCQQALGRVDGQRKRWGK